MLDFPPEFDRRGDPRLPQHEPCEIDTPAGRHPARIVDVSHSGVFLRTDAPVECGAAVKLYRAGDALSAVVVHCETVPLSRQHVLARGAGLRLLARDA